MCRQKCCRSVSAIMSLCLVTLACVVPTILSAGSDDDELRADGLMVTRPAGEESLRVASWNVATSIDFGRFDRELCRKHAWRARKAAALDAVRRLRPDVLGLQELSAEQARDFGGLDGYALEHSTKKPLGLMLGILYRPEVLNLLMCASFSIQDDGDAEEDDDPYRRVWYARFAHRCSGRSLYLFNSHYPLIEGADGRRIRCQCAQKEIEGIGQIVGLNPGLEEDRPELCVSVGDRNTIPVGSRQTDDVGASLVPLLLQLHDCRKSGVSGPSTTFAGFTHDDHENPVVGGQFTKNTVLDVLAANQLPLRAMHVLVQYKPDSQRAMLNPAVVDVDRHFASDHLMVVADYATSR